MGKDQFLERAHINPEYDSDEDGNVDSGSVEGSYTDEDAQDAVGTILNDDFNYDDAGDTISLNTPFTDLTSLFGASPTVGGDGVTLLYGAAPDVSSRYDSGNDDLRWQDEQNDQDRMALDRSTGDLTIEGTLDESGAL